jgi:hypothetical protein
MTAMTDKDKETTSENTSEEVEVSVSEDQRTVTFGYSYKQGLPNYSNHEVSIYAKDKVPKSTRNVVKWVSEKAEPAINELKVQVWAALGLSFSYDDLGTPKLDEPSPVVAPTTPPPAAAPVQASGTAVPDAPPSGGVPPPPQQPYQSGQAPSFAQPTMYAPQPDFCKQCSGREFYDNRVEQDQKMAQGRKIGPDYKCKACNKGVFRPGSYDYNQSVGAGGGGNAQGGAPMMPPGGENPY